MSCNLTSASDKIYFLETCKLDINATSTHKILMKHLEEFLFLEEGAHVLHWAHNEEGA